MYFSSSSSSSSCSLINNSVCVWCRFSNGLFLIPNAYQYAFRLVGNSIAVILLLNFVTLTVVGCLRQRARAARERELRLLPESTARLLGFDASTNETLQGSSSSLSAEHEQLQFEQEWHERQLQYDMLDTDELRLQRSPYYRSTSPSSSSSRDRTTLGGRTRSAAQLTSTTAATTSNAARYPTNADHHQLDRRASDLTPLTSYLAGGGSAGSGGGASGGALFSSPSSSRITGRSINGGGGGFGSTRYTSASAPVSPINRANKFVVFIYFCILYFE